jgi:hypothetical protein
VHACPDATSASSFGAVALTERTPVRHERV